jgi:hypothetical protein
LSFLLSFVVDSFGCKRAFLQRLVGLCFNQNGKQWARRRGESEEETQSIDHELEYDFTTFWSEPPLYLYKTIGEARIANSQS